MQVLGVRLEVWTPRAIENKYSRKQPMFFVKDAYANRLLLWVYFYHIFIKISFLV
jgi:hypothetical protein